MAKEIKNVRSITEEALFLKEKEMDYSLAKVFSGDWKGSREERKELGKLKNLLKDDMYIEVIYILTHKIIRDVKEAKHLYINIIDHKYALLKKLKRNVGIEVASLDYFKNIVAKLEQPEIIEKEKLSKLVTKAITDEATGLYERSTLFANLEAEIERARRYKRPLSLLFCDLDDFKAINDTYGHKSGDLVLKKVANIISGVMRTTDRMYRYGGEEFVCVLTETDAKSARVAARRIRKKVSSSLIKLEKNNVRINITVSLGIAQYATYGIDDMRSFIGEADKAMYRAKEAGKNCVCIHGEEKESIKKTNKKSDKSPARKKKIIIKGSVLSPGLAIGDAFIYKDILTRDMAVYSISEHQIDDEIKRIENAMKHASADLQKMKSIVKIDVDKQHADIFDTHKEILKDEQLIQDLENELEKELVNAEQIVKNVFRKWANKFKTSDKDFIRSKADDLEDLSRRLLRILLGYEKNVLEKLPDNSIVVAARLLPSDTVHMKAKSVKGIVVKKGSRNSHSAILARALGVPAISNIGREYELINSKDKIIIDGEKGIVITYPTEKDKSRYLDKIGEASKKESAKDARATPAAKTRDGKLIKVCANASSKEEFRTALVKGCDGIGLFRIEKLYLASKRLPDEEYLMTNLQKVLKEAKDKEVKLRLLDVGGDKKLSYLEMDDELNPSLGLRGIRLLLKHENMLKTQLRAIIKLSKKYKIRILIPMITLPREINEVKRLVENCTAEVSKEQNQSFEKIKIGAMIETPASVSNIEEIAKLSDFISIGTNDLMQYLMAAGRENVSVSEYHDQGSEVLLKSIKIIARTAKQFDIECSICGEIAGDLDYTETFIKLGVNELSVVPHGIPSLKEKIRGISFEN